MRTVVRAPGPRALSAMELIKTLIIDDSSLAAIANCMKQHSVNHAMWIAYERETFQRKLKLEHLLEIRESELVSHYMQTAKSASATTNYAKYELPIHPDIKQLREDIIDCASLLSFIQQASRLFSKRADILTALLKIDNEVIVRDRREAFDLNVELRNAIGTFNSIISHMNSPWVVQEKN